MVHQHFKLVDVLTAAENIVLGLPGKARLNMKKNNRRYSETGSINMVLIWTFPKKIYENVRF